MHFPFNIKSDRIHFNESNPRYWRKKIMNSDQLLAENSNFTLKAIDLSMNVAFSLSTL